MKTYTTVLRFQTCAQKVCTKS